MDSVFYDSTSRLLEQECTPAVIRQIESTGQASALWASLEQSGFADALVPEAANGAGLSLADAWPIVFALGRHAVPAPFAQTMMARAWLHAAGLNTPAGSIAFAPFQVTEADGKLSCRNVTFGRVADHVIAQLDQRVLVLAAKDASISISGGHGSLDADMQWPVASLNAAQQAQAKPHLMADLQAWCLAALIAGASDRVLEMTLDYANQREQFGKPIGRFQAMQQQISEMAELVFGVRMASEMSCRSDGFEPAPLLAALAKMQCSQAVAKIAAITHATHGAIGVTQEYDLQLYTRRLREWARAGGGQGYWASRIGAQALASPHGALDFIRESLF